MAIDNNAVFVLIAKIRPHPDYREMRVGVTRAKKASSSYTTDSVVSMYLLSFLAVPHRLEDTRSTSLEKVLIEHLCDKSAPTLLFAVDTQCRRS
jgi:hypothetical protein